HGERDLGTHTLHGLQQTEPFALDVGAEAEQPDLILAHVGFDRQRGGLADTRQFLQRARGALYEVADAVDVEDDEILAVTIDDALELADHARAYLTDATAASKAPAKTSAARSMATFPNKRDRNLVDRRRRQQPAAAQSARRRLEHGAAAMMRMAHRDRERVRRVLRLPIGLRPQLAHPHSTLPLLAVAGADDGLFHQIRSVFGDRQARDRRHQHGDTAR